MLCSALVLDWWWLRDGFEDFAEPSRAQVDGGDEEERAGPRHQKHESVELKIRDAKIACRVDVMGRVCLGARVRVCACRKTFAVTCCELCAF